MNLFGPLDTQYCLLFNILSIMGVLLCFSVFFLNKGWLLIGSLLIIYFMIFFQNRLLYNMCIKKEGFKVSIEHSDIQKIINNLLRNFCANNNKTRDHIRYMYDSIGILLDSNSYNAEQIITAINAIQEAVGNNMISPDHSMRSYPSTFRTSINGKKKYAEAVNVALTALNNSGVKPNDIKNFFNNILQIRRDCISNPNNSLHQIKELTSEMKELYVYISANEKKKYAINENEFTRFAIKPLKKFIGNTYGNTYTCETITPPVCAKCGEPAFCTSTGWLCPTVWTKDNRLGPANNRCIP